MEPPHCEVCAGAPSERSRGFDTVAFADLTPLPRWQAGHPEGVVRFCPRHLAVARDLTHLGWRAALEKIPGLESDTQEPC